jgi:hypothetical protein
MPSGDRCPTRRTRRDPGSRSCRRPLDRSVVLAGPGDTQGGPSSDGAFLARGSKELEDRRADLLPLL